MYHHVLPGTKLYRVTSLGTNWPTPLHGHGAYFTKRGRYNRIYQPTVYCSEDPLVAIAEAGFYQAHEWHEKISVYRVNPVSYPLITSHRLWYFTFNTSLPLVDVMTTNAFFRFQFSPHMLLNPSQIYAATQGLADDIRSTNSTTWLNRPQTRGSEGSVR